MSGIQAYAGYVPYWRLQRKAIGAALGSRAGKGTRAVASYDEDSTSMAVEASRRALAQHGLSAAGSLFLATTSPAYLDKANAATIHAALDLPGSVFAADVAGSVRSATAAFRAGAKTGEALVVASDVRTGLPASGDESNGGDGAAAFVLGDTPGIAEILATAASTVEILDRWRIPGEPSSRLWEERFGEPVYVAAAEQAFTDALKQADLTAAGVDRLLVTGIHARAARVLTKALGVRAEAVTPDLVDVIGNAGAAQPGLVLAATLDVAAPGEVIALVVLADGADVTLLRTTDALTTGRQTLPIAAQIAAGNDTLSYADFLTWRGLLHREPPRRPEPDLPMSPPSLRSSRWKFGLVGSKCLRCDTRFAPPQRVCLGCGAVDEMTPERFADDRGTVRTFTVDRLAFTPSPPLVMAVIDFAEGGRFECEVTDITGPEEVAVGAELDLTFRCLYTTAGVHNYFWKARPVRVAREDVTA